MTTKAIASPIAITAASWPPTDRRPPEGGVLEAFVVIVLLGRLSGAVALADRRFPEVYLPDLKGKLIKTIMKTGEI